MTTIPTLAAPPERATVLHQDPLIFQVDDVIDAATCQHIIGLAQPQRRRAEVSGAQKGQQSAGRTNDVVWLKHDTTPTTARICRALAELVGLPLVNAESMQVITYEVGQEYRPHFDAYDLSTPRGQRCCARGGQRLATLLAYLSDVDEGGETTFPRLGVAVPPKRGRALVFHNCSPGTDTRHPDTLHAGAPVKGGTKWAFNLWFHVGPFR
ncbi:MAG: 2OG-Fe(II) oxygenase [Myxococcales bacterium]|nr:2OG-Fe(II) oxygenase [Myxococcales bacterium]MCB9702092.1 2OG-Fe(II) oxygenase [Myxococcales bacterium]